MQSKGLKTAYFLILAAFLSAFHEAYADSMPLRIWVMPNDISTESKTLTKKQIHDLIKDLENDHNIIIENTLQDLMLPAQIGKENTLAPYTVVKNPFIEELKHFQKSQTVARPIKVEFIRWNNAFSRLTTAVDSLALDNMPDIVQIGSTWVPTFADFKAIENLSDLVNEDDFFKPSIDSAKPYSRHGLYAIPWFVETRMIYYHKSLVSNPEAVFESHETMIQNAQKIIDANPQLKSFLAISTEMSWNLLHNLVPWLWGEGGDIIKPRTILGIPFHKVVVDSENSLKGFDSLHNLFEKGIAYFAPVPAEKMEQDFLDGKYAAIFTGSWFNESLRSSGRSKEVDIALIPKGDAGQFPFVGGSHLAIWHASKKKENFDLAIKLMNFLTGAQSQERFSSSINTLPARTSEMSGFFSRPEMKNFNEALKIGKSYPAIPEWGSIVENEHVRNDIWQIWENLSQGKSIALLHQSVKKMADNLRKQIFFATIRKNAVPLTGLFISSLILFGYLHLRSRNRFEDLQRKFSDTVDKLDKIIGDKRILEAQHELLKKAHQNEGERLADFETKIKSLNLREGNLKKALEEMTQRRDSIRKESNLDKIFISWDGTLLLENKIVDLKNSLQTKIIIEYLSRCSVEGENLINAVVGYPLFDWDPKLKTPPIRLFETLIAKINSSLKKHSLPPLLAREKRKSWNWRVLWDQKIWNEQSAIGKAHQIYKNMDDPDSFSDKAEFIKEMISIINLDPRFLQAYTELKKYDERSFEKHLPKLQTATAKITGWKKGIINARSYLDKFNNIIDEEIQQLREVIDLFDQRIAMIEDEISNLNSHSPETKLPICVSRAIKAVQEIHRIHERLKSKHIDDFETWSSIIQNPTFNELVSIPDLKEIINNIWDRDGERREDPRLVQLALIQTCSKKENVDLLTEAQNKPDFFITIKRQVSKQLVELGKSFSTLPEY